MAQLNENRYKIESSFMSVYWKFRKEFGDPENDESYWSGMVKKIDEIGTQFNHDPYIESILFICIDDLEKRAHEMFGSGFKYHNYDLVLGTINRIRSKRGLPNVTVAKT